jgi:hypothetical protein
LHSQFREKKKTRENFAPQVRDALPSTRSLPHSDVRNAQQCGAEGRKEKIENYFRTFNGNNFLVTCYRCYKNVMILVNNYLLLLLILSRTLTHTQNQKISLIQRPLLNQARLLGLSGGKQKDIKVDKEAVWKEAQSAKIKTWVRRFYQLSGRKHRARKSRLG